MSVKLVPADAPARLEELIQKRISSSSSERKKIDEKIWSSFGEKWSIVYTDLIGFSRYSAEYGITHFLQNIRESHRILSPIIHDYNGVLLKEEGDSMLLLFHRPQDAFDCSVEMQRSCKLYSTDKKEEDKILLCVGIGYGDILFVGNDAYGVEVNAACKLGEDTAKQNEIIITEAIKNVINIPEFYSIEKTLAPYGIPAAYKIVF